MSSTWQLFWLPTEITEELEEDNWRWDEIRRGLHLVKLYDNFFNISSFWVRWYSPLVVLKWLIPLWQWARWLPHRIKRQVRRRL